MSLFMSSDISEVTDGVRCDALRCIDAVPWGSPGLSWGLRGISLAPLGPGLFWGLLEYPGVLLGSPGVSSAPLGSRGHSWTILGLAWPLLGSPWFSWRSPRLSCGPLSFPDLSWGLLASPKALQAGVGAGHRRQEVGQRGASPWDTGMVAAEPPPKDGVARAGENAARVALSHPESP